jgi:glutamine synthetase
VLRFPDALANPYLAFGAMSRVMGEAIRGGPASEIAPEEPRPRDDEELFRSTLAPFAQRRLTGTTTERLAACRDLTVERSPLILENGRPWRAGA